MNKKSFIYALIFLSGILRSQNIIFSGQVYGFNSEKVLLLRKASKNLGFEGPLENVTLSFKFSGKELLAKTDNSGFYAVTLPDAGNIELSISKDGFSKASIKLNANGSFGRARITSLNFILKKNDDTQNELGVISSNEGKLQYQFNEHPKKENPDVMQSNKILIEKCIEFNNSNKVASIPNTNAIAPKVEKQVVTTTEKQTVSKEVFAPLPKADTINHHYSHKILSLSEKFNNINDSNIGSFKTELDQLKEELNRMAAAGEDVTLLRKQIAEAESKLSMKEELIASQQLSIQRANRVIIFMVLFSVFLLASIGLIFYYLQQKKKFNAVLTLKNNEITKVNQRLLSSIKYASVIQSNLLSNIQELSSLFPQSFIYNKPKDFLSGDFFWCFEKGGKIFVAVADCTGHGVPGALLSVLGQRFLNETVEKEGLNEPSMIIQKLENKFVNAFKDQKSVEYGIELGLICFDKQKSVLIFSSNGMNMYLYHQKKMVCITPQYDVQNNGSVLLPKDQSFELSKGDCAYLSSDGFADQFGMIDGKTKKYNLSSMIELMKQVSEKEFQQANTIIEKEHVKWKGNQAQTDDILIAGIKI